MKIINMFDYFSFSQFDTVLFHQLKTELAEDLQKGHIWKLCPSLLWLQKCKMHTVPVSKHNTQQV